MGKTCKLKKNNKKKKKEKKKKAKTNICLSDQTRVSCIASRLFTV